MQVNDTAILEFHAYGLTSEEEYRVVEIDGNVCTLDTSEEPHRCFRFDIETGECLNDEVWDNSHRTLKVNTESNAVDRTKNQTLKGEVNAYR